MANNSKKPDPLQAAAAMTNPQPPPAPPAPNPQPAPAPAPPAHTADEEQGPPSPGDASDAWDDDEEIEEGGAGVEDPALAELLHAGVEVEAPETEKAPEIVKPPAPAPHGQAPKYLLGAFLKIPGGVSGRVTGVFPTWEEADQDPDVKKGGGMEKCYRSKRGRGAKSPGHRYYYKCKNNGQKHPLVVGELDAHMLSQGPAPKK